jgi:hypothetical protein
MEKEQRIDKKYIVEKRYWRSEKKLNQDLEKERVG